MEKNNIFENNVGNIKYYDLNPHFNETPKASINNNERELPFGPDPIKKEYIYEDINNSRIIEEEQYNYYDDNEYTLEDTWDAMTDGMYGDMPEGWDGDLEFLGY